MNSNMDPRHGIHSTKPSSFDGDPLILVFFMDDMFLLGTERLIVWCKREFALKFEMKDIGLMHYFLGLEAWLRSNKILLG